MSILSALRNGKITALQALALTETWAGQELKQLPGGQYVEGVINDLAGAGANTADSALVTFSKAAEVPVDAFLAAKLGAAAPQTISDANAAIDAQTNAAIAFIQLQASNLKQNVALGYAGATAAPSPPAPAE